jgi:hypothetical protein
MNSFLTIITCLHNPKFLISRLTPNKKSLQNVAKRPRPALSKINDHDNAFPNKNFSSQLLPFRCKFSLLYFAKFRPWGDFGLSDLLPVPPACGCIPTSPFFQFPFKNAIQISGKGML